MQHPCGNGCVADFIDQNETTEITIVGIGLKNDRAIRRNFSHANAIEFQRFRSQLLHIVDIDLIFRLLHGGAYKLGADLHPIAATR